MDKLEQYLDHVCRSIGGPRALRQHVRQELREHLRDAVAEHQVAGMSADEALARALTDFGGPDQVRSELEATHGHRLLPVVLDKAMQWKEMTMRARWLWTTWAYLAVVCLLVLEVLHLCFANIYLVPKLKKIRGDGWLEEAGEYPSIQWLYRFLNRMDWVIDNLTWFLLGLIALWGLFEWRVRSENKPFMRLSALSTGALGLAICVFLVMAALVLPFMMGFPAVSKLARPFAIQETFHIDAVLEEMEKSLTKKDWPAVEKHSSEVSRGLSRFNAALPAVPYGSEGPTLEQLKTQWQAAKDKLAEVDAAIASKDATRLEAALQEFRKAYQPLRDAAKRQVK